MFEMVRRWRCRREVNRVIPWGYRSIMARTEGAFLREPAFAHRVGPGNHFTTVPKCPFLERHNLS